MNGFRYALAAGVIVALVTTRVAGGDEAARDVPRVAVDLTDGSYLIGTPSIAAIPVQTAYAKLDLPLRQIVQVKIESNHETGVFELLGGDRITGTITLGPFKLATLFGNVPLDLGHVTTLKVLSAGLTTGLVLHYTFDRDERGVVRDESGRGHDGYLVGAVAYEDSRKGKAARLTGPGTYMVSAAKGLNVKGWRALTLAAWVKARRFTTYGSLLSRGQVDGPKNGGFSLSLGGTFEGKWYAGGFNVAIKPEGRFGVTPRTLAAGVTPPPSLEQWYHLVGTYDGQVVRYYVNGSLDGEAKCAEVGQPLWDEPDAKLVIGTAGAKPYIAWADQYVEGLIDDVMIFDRALAENDVRQLYERQQ